MRRLLLITVLATTACGGEFIEEETASRSASITDGVVDTGHAAVGLMEYIVPCPDDPSASCQGWCSATLVGQRTVLTAAHCLEGVTDVTGVEFGGQSYAVSTWVSHPGYAWKTPPADYPVPGLADYGEFDIAIVRLTQAPPITPHPIAVSMPDVGTQVTIVGFGATYLDEMVLDPTKRKATNTVSGVASHEIFMEGTGGGEGNVCPGDSGGPAFVQLAGVEVVYGVASWILGESCGILGTHSRVDVALPWLQQASQGDLQVYDGSTPPPPAQDTMPPVVQILTPMPNATIAALLSVSAQVTDDGQLSTVTLRVDGVEMASLQQGPYTFQVPLAPGNHVVEILAYDAAGNQGQASVSVVSTTTTAPPTTGPAATPTSSSPAMINGSCSITASAGSFGLPLLLFGLLLFRRRRRPQA